MAEISSITLPDGTSYNLKDASARSSMPVAATASPQKDGTAAVGTSAKYAKEDHVHPLNVPTSGTPANLGTASNGSATTYARSDHVHNTPLPSVTTSDNGKYLIVANGSWATSGLPYEIYDSVSQLGLTVGSATIAAAFSAMTTDKILITDAEEFASSEVPNAYGTIMMSKRKNYRGHIIFYGKEDKNGEFRMYLTTQGNPTGVWTVEKDNLDPYLSSRKIFMIGDSYANGYMGISGQGWPYYFNQQNSVNGTIVHQDGGGFASTGNNSATYPGLTFPEVLDELSASAHYDLIIAQAGWNDAGTDKNPTGIPAIVSGVESFVSKARAKWPGVEIVIIPMHPDITFINDREARLESMAQTAFDCHVRSTTQSPYWMIGQGVTASDQVHLTDSGYQLLAQYITRFVNGWDGVVSRPHILNRLSFSGTTNSNGAISLTSVVDDLDGVIAVKCTNITDAVCIPWKYSNGNWWCWVQKWNTRAFYNSTAVTLEVTYCKR